MQGRIGITLIRNPFKPIESQETRFLEALKPVSLQEVIRQYYPAPFDTGFDVAVSINGRLLDENINTTTYLVNPGDYVAFCAIPKGGGGGKDIARAVAMLALVVVSIALPGSGLIIAGTTIIPGLGLSGVSAAIMSAGIMMAGSYLINALLPPSIPDTEGFELGDLKNSPTYSWEPQGNLYQENIALPVLYGTHRIKPPCIGRYVSTSGDKQYLNLLYAIAGHAVDEIDDIEINNTPIDYYSSIEVEKRYGSTNQEIIPYFQDTFSDQAVGIQLSTSYTTKQTAGNSVNAIGIGITLPQGLFYANNSGGLDAQSVTFQIQYRRVGYLSWNNFGEYTITEATNSTIRRYYFITGLPSAQYEVRIKLKEALPTGSRYRNATYWEYMQEIVSDNFIYPGISLLALKILATDQLSGSTPEVTCIAKRNYVSVWTGSSYENKPATNPAWVCYDIIHNENCGDIPHSSIIYEKFAEWASWCSEKDCTCNIYFDTIMSLKKALDMVSQLGRGSIIQVGSKFSCVFDSEDLPVQRFMFTMGNIIKDSFQETWLSTDERANVLEVSYYDEELNYSKQTITLEQEGLNTENELKTTQIDLIGCTSRDMAIRHAKYLLNCNRYLTNTVSFNADVDAIACLPGDVIEVAHDVPQWGYSGRVVSATSTTVTLDREVTLSPSTTYVITVQHYESDDRETRYVQSVAQETTTDTLTVTSSWTVTPSKYALYSFGTVNQATKLFRVINISRASDMTRKITALEYWPDVYDDDVELPEFTNISDLNPVIGLSASENLKFGADGTVKNIVSLTWRGSAIKWYVYVSTTSDSGPWRLDGIAYNPFYEIENLIPGKTYYFTVNSKPNPYEYTPVSITYSGQAYTPPTPSGLTATLSGQFIVLNWTPNTDIGTYGYNIYLNDSLIVSNYTSNRYIYRGNLTAGTYTFKITALNRNLSESNSSQTASITISNPSTPSPSQSVSGEIATISWANCQTSLPISHYLVNSTNVGNTTRYQARVNWTGTQTFSVKAVDIAGNESSTGSVNVTITAVPTPTGLTATGKTYQIVLTATATIPEGGVLEIWSATVNNRASAVKIGDSASTTFTHTGLGLVDTRYYWIRVRDKYGNVGSWYPSSATGGVMGQTSIDPSDYLTLLDGEIGEDQLSQDLATRINTIDRDYVYEKGVYVYENPFTMVFGGLDKMVDGVYTTVVSHGSSITALFSEAQEHASAISSLQSEIAGLTTEQWSNTESYTVGRYVVHEGKVYRCKQGYTPPPAYEPGEVGSEAYWEDAQAIVNLVTEIDNRVDTLEGQIVTKVSQTDFNALSNTVSSHTTSISQLSSQIALKVSQSDFNAFSVMFLPVFSASNTYPENYMVRYSTGVYKCIKEINFTPAPYPTNTEYWELTQFVDEFSTALSEIEVNSNSISIHTGQISSLNSSVSSIDSRLTSAETSISSHSSTISNHESRIGSAETTISTHSSEISGLDLRLDSAENNITSLDGRLDSAETVIDSHSSTLSSYGNRISSAETTITTHTSQISTLQSTTTNHETRLSSAETTIASHSSTLTNYGSRLSSAESTISTHTSQISGLQSETISLDGRLDTAESNITSLDTRMDSAETTISSHSSTLSELDSRLDNAEITLTTQTQAITGDITFLFSPTRIYENDIYVEDASDVKNIDLRLTQAEFDIIGLEGIADWATTEISSHSSTLVNHESRLNSAEILLSTHTGELSTLDGRLDTAETTITSHSTTLTNYGNRISSAETTISSHTSSISDHETRISSAETAITAGQAGTWSSIENKLAISTYNQDQKDANSYLRIAALENRFLVYDTQNAQIWNNSTTYYPGTIVKSGSAYYRCIKTSTNNQPPNTTYWTAISAGLLSQWTLKLNTNNRVAGIGLMLDDSAGSEFVILADKFKIMRPDEQGNPVQIFTAGQINGQNTVGISGDLIVDGSIVARNIGANQIITYSGNIAGNIIETTHIKDAAITNAKIQDAAITNAKISSLDASKITTGYISADRIQAGSITSDKLSVTNLSAISANLGTVTAGVAQSSDNKLKIDFNNKYIRVYDENSVLRVEIGYLT